jgi:hypothetical protein
MSTPPIFQPKPDRRIRQIAMCESDDVESFSRIAALCEDGTLWLLHCGDKGGSSGARWERMPPVPDD